MAVIIDGTAGIANNATDLSYTGTLTGGTGVVNLGSGQVYKDASGNVGIGTSSPRSVGGYTALGLNNTTGVLIDCFVGGTRSSTIATTATDMTLGSIASMPLRFTTADTERARIDSSGNLLVGVTSSNGNVGGIAVSSTSTTKEALVLNQTNSAGTTYKLISGFYGVFGVSAAESFRVFNNGNVQNSNNSYGAISDIKLKENIVDATPKLDKLNQVRIVNYNLIGEQQKQIGVIAQELEQLFPSMIDETPDRDTEGNDLGTTTKSVKYSVFVPMLIKAIQEQQTIIVSLQDTLTALTARITALEAV